jgi:hypothetical protein
VIEQRFFDVGVPVARGDTAALPPTREEIEKCSLSPRITCCRVIDDGIFEQLDTDQHFCSFGAKM